MDNEYLDDDEYRQQLAAAAKELGNAIRTYLWELVRITKHPQWELIPTSSTASAARSTPARRTQP